MLSSNWEVVLFIALTKLIILIISDHSLVYLRTQLSEKLKIIDTSKLANNEFYNGNEQHSFIKVSVTHNIVRIQNNGLDQRLWRQSSLPELQRLIEIQHDPMWSKAYLIRTLVMSPLFNRLVYHRLLYISSFNNRQFY